jgi:hypothetical protein
MLVTYKVPATEEKTVEVKTPMYARINNYKCACLNDNGSIMEVCNFDDSTTIVTRKKGAYSYTGALTDIMNGTPISADEFFAFAERTRSLSESITLQPEAI